MKSFVLYGSLIAIVLAGSPAIAAAQDKKSGLAIAAVVGADAISSYDVDMRLKFLVVTSGLPNTPDVIAKVRPQVIRSLIDEKLELQEAKRYNFEASPQEVEEAIRTLQKERNMPDNAIYNLMREHGIPKEVFQEQIHAQLAWRKYVIKRLRPQLRVSDEEVEIAKKNYKEAPPTPDEFQIAVLTLPVDKPAREKEVQSIIQKLAKELRAGASFEEVSRQLAGDTGGVRGKADAFWVRPGQLEPNLARALASAQAGTITEPVRTPVGYTIVKVYDTRSRASVPAKEDTPEALNERIRNQIYQHKLELAVQKTLRDLKRDTFVEVR